MTGTHAKRVISSWRPAFLLSSLLMLASCSDSAPTPPAPDPVSVVTESLSEAIEQGTYTQQLAAAGGRGGYSWGLAAGSLPSGLTLSPTGLISGTPVGAGTSSFRVRVTDAGGVAGTEDLSIVVVQKLALHTLTLPDALSGAGYTAQIQAVGGRGTLNWTLSGAAASWLTVSPTGALSGTPTVSGASTVTATVADASGQQASRQFPIMIRAPLTVAAIALPVGVELRAYAAQLVATGGDGVYTWMVESGALPTGVTMTPGGAITGTPADDGEFTFAAKVTDGAGRVATRPLVLTVDRAPLIQTAILPPGDVGAPYQTQLVAAGGTGAYSWSVTQGALPAGLTLATSGAITGTPAALGSSTFTVRVTDAMGKTHTRAFTLVVAQFSELASGVAVTGISGATGSVRYYAIQVPTGATQLTISISGGTGDADLYIRRGALPQDFVYDCRPLRLGNEETCTVTSPAAGYWYIMVRGSTDFGEVRLVATHDG